MACESFEAEMIESTTKIEPFEDSAIDSSIINKTHCESSRLDGREESKPEVQFPVQVIRMKGNDLELNAEGLENILLDERVRDKPVVVVSISGAFRMGKSFMLNFFLRYLQTQRENWLNTESDNVLKGFEWRKGAERVTTGIWLWNHPFICNVPEVGEVAVLVMDTQGLYDRQTSLKGCCNVFAMSVLLSSVQVFNLQSRLQTSDFEHLQFFGEYAKMVLEGKAENEENPFHRLTLLIRDWQLSEEYGWEAGNNILKSFFAEDSSGDIKEIRESIRACFDKIDCFLMPHPGKAVATGRGFCGEVKEIDCDFVESVRQFVPELLAADKMVLKKIAGRTVDCAQLFDLFRTYSKTFSGTGLPQPKVVFDCMVEATNLTALQTAETFYNASMEKLVKKEKPLRSEQFKSAHEKFRNEALNIFESTRKMGGPSQSVPYVKQLESSIATKYTATIEENRRNIDSLTKSLRLKAENCYKTEMERFLGDSFVEPSDLLGKHEQLCQKALKMFEEAVDLGGDCDTLLGVFELGLSKARTQNELAKALKSKLDADVTIAEITAENRRVSTRIAQLERDNMEKDTKMASLEARVNRLTISQASHNDSGFGYSPAVGYTHNYSYAPSYSPVPSFGGALSSTPVTFSGSSSKPASIKPAPSPGAAPPGKVYVSGYTRSNGTAVSGYYRNARGGSNK